MKSEKLLSSTPPVWLPPYAKEVFRQTCRQLAAAGRPLRETHLQTLIGLSQAADLARQAAEAIATEGFSMPGGRDGSKRHPAVSAQIAALASVRAFAESLGITPASDSRRPKVAPSKTIGKFRNI